MNNNYLALSTANNKFSSFNIRPKRKRWLGKVVLAVLLIISMNLAYFSQGVTLVQASPGTQIRTVEFHIFTSDLDGSAADYICDGCGMDDGTWDDTTPTFTINLPESSITVRRAIVEWNTITDGKVIDPTNFDWKFRKQSDPTFLTTIDITDGIDGSTKVNHIYTFFFDVTSRVTSGSNTYEFDARMEGDLRTADTAKLYVTYEYDDASTTQVKTVRYFVGCEPTEQLSTTDLTFSYDDYTVNPDLKEGTSVIESHWVELRGSTDGNHNMNSDITFQAKFNSTVSDQEGWIDTNNSKGNDPFLMMATFTSETFNKNSNNTISLGFAATVSGQGEVPIQALCGEWVITYSYDHSSMAGDDETHTRTARYLMGTTSGCGSGDCWLPTSQTTMGAARSIYIPEDSPTFKSVWIRYFISGILTSNFEAESTLGSDTSTQGTDFDFQIGKSSYGAFVGYDVTSQYQTYYTSSPTTHTAKGRATVSSALEGVWAEVIITYEFNAETNTSNDIKTVYWWVEQSTAGRQADFTQATESWSNTFYTYIPESGTKTWRSSAFITDFSRGNNDGMAQETRTHTVTVNDTTVTGSGDSQVEAAIKDLKVEMMPYWVAVYTDVEMNKISGGSLISQSNIEYTIKLDDYYDEGEDATMEIQPSSIAYTTYEYDGPEVPEKVLIALGLAFIIPALVRLWKRRRKGRLGVVFDLKGERPPSAWLKARKPFNKGPGPP